MGTKNDPGKFDCYAKAEPDEPMFVLLGRDRHAAGLVKLWGLLRAMEGEDEAVTAEAFDCADLMDAFRAKGGAKQTRVFDKIFMALTEGMAEHPDGFLDEARPSAVIDGRVAAKSPLMNRKTLRRCDTLIQNRERLFDMLKAISEGTAMSIVFTDSDLGLQIPASHHVSELGRDVVNVKIKEINAELRSLGIEPGADEIIDHQASDVEESV